MNVFQDYAYYYDLFYGNKDYYGEAQVVDKLLKSYGKDITIILNLGCGTGKHDLELSKLKYKMQGIDLSQMMIKQANILQKENMQATMAFEVGDARSYRDKKEYDAVISLFHVMSYQNTNKDILDFFQTAYEELSEGGIFLFDAWYGPGVLTEKPEVRVKKLEDEKNKIIRIATPNLDAETNVVNINYEILICNKEENKLGRIEENHNMRYFFKPEIKFYLEKVGFELLECLDCNTLTKTDYNTWTAYFIAKKRR